MSHDSSHTILSSLRRFLSGTLLSRFSGFGREVAMAAVFGTTPAVAAFWMAFRFANLFRRLFGEGGLHIAFVPHFEELRAKDPKAAASFFFDLTFNLIGVLLSLAVVLEVVLGLFLVFGGFSPENREILRLTMLLLPSFVFISLFALNSSFLSCQKIFFLPAASPTVLNLVWIGALFLLPKALPEVRLEWLSVIIVFAFALQWFVTAIPTYQILKETLPKKEKIEAGKKELVKLLKPFLLAIIGVAATQINNALDAVFARFSDPQGPATLWYALRLQQVPLALFGVGLSSALLPPISRAIQEANRENYSKFLTLACEKATALMVPLTFALFATGLSSINLIYGRGAFLEGSVIATTKCLWGYSAGLLPMTLVFVFASAFYAEKNYKIPTIASLCSVALNIGLNALFVFPLKMGAISVAYATSLAALFNAAFLLYFLSRKNSPFAHKGKELALSGIKVLAATFLATAATVLISKKVIAISLPRSFSGQVGLFSCEAFVFVSVLLLSAYLLRANHLLELITLRARK